MDVNRKLSEGEIVCFGNWPQGSNGEIMPLEWIILSASSRSAWMVTKHIIECSRFSWSYSAFSAKRNVRWKDSEIRGWLNGAFLSEAFSPEEQELLASQVLHCGKYWNRRTCDWNDRTEDKVALLRCEDVTYTLSRLGIADCTPTPYAVSRGASEETHIWWLREQGEPAYRTAIVSNGILSQHGADSVREYGIRPAIELRFPQTDDAEAIKAQPEDVGAKVEIK